MTALAANAVLDLDAELPAELLDTETLSGAHLVLRQALQEAVRGGCSALNLFYHEEDDHVRECLWKTPGAGHSGWGEWVPLAGDVGRQLLLDLRACGGQDQDHPGPVRGELQYTYGGRAGRITLESPHVWDVRLYLDERRPAALPYTLVFRGVAEAEAEAEVEAKVLRAGGRRTP